jgi:hypothetical protein
MRRMLTENVRIGLTEVVQVGRQAKCPACLVIDQDETPRSIDRQHTVAHIGNHVAKEFVRRAACPRAARWFSHEWRPSNGSHDRHKDVASRIANDVPQR